MEKPYHPVPCTFHDRILHFATTRETLDIEFIDAKNGKVRQRAFVADVYTRHSAEWMLLSSGEVIRLDDLLRIGDFEANDFFACSV